MLLTNSYAHLTCTDNKDSSNEDRKPGSDIENGVDKKELINFSRARDSPGGAEFCRKLERLIHIELADLVVNTPYLSENFPNASTQGSLISSPKLETPKSGRRSSGSLSTFYQELQECVDCGCTLLIHCRWHFSHYD